MPMCIRRYRPAAKFAVRSTRPTTRISWQPRRRVVDERQSTVGGHHVSGPPTARHLVRIQRPYFLRLPAFFARFRPPVFPAALRPPFRAAFLSPAYPPPPPVGPPPPP